MPKSYLEVAQIIQAIFTAAGIIVAGVWGYFLFWRRRETRAKVTISHRVRYDRISSDQALLTVDVIVTNISNILVVIQKYTITAKQILPPVNQLQDFLDNNLLEQSQVGLQITQWHVMASRMEEHAQIELEPNESMPLHLTFLVQDSAEIIEVESAFHNRAMPDKGLYWSHYTIHDTKGAKRHGEPAVIFRRIQS